MQVIGSPKYCFAVTRMAQTLKNITVTRECNLKTILSILTGSFCRRSCTGLNNSSILVLCVDGKETRKARSLSSGWPIHMNQKM